MNRCQLRYSIDPQNWMLRLSRGGREWVKRLRFAKQIARDRFQEKSFLRSPAQSLPAASLNRPELDPRGQELPHVLGVRVQHSPI